MKSKNAISVMKVFELSIRRWDISIPMRRVLLLRNVKRADRHQVVCWDIQLTVRNVQGAAYLPLKP